MSTVLESGFEGVTTASRVRVWWLTNFRGYRVARTTMAPRSDMFGKIRYLQTWWLKTHSGEKRSQTER